MEKNISASADIYSQSQRKNQLIMVMMDISYGFAANKELVEYYCNKFGALHRPIDHPYDVIFDEFAANSILKEYNYERKNK